MSVCILCCFRTRLFQFLKFVNSVQIFLKAIQILYIHMFCLSITSFVRSFVTFMFVFVSHLTCRVVVLWRCFIHSWRLWRVFLMFVSLLGLIHLECVGPIRTFRNFFMYISMYEIYLYNSSFFLSWDFSLGLGLIFCMSFVNLCDLSFVCSCVVKWNIFYYYILTKRCIKFWDVLATNVLKCWYRNIWSTQFNRSPCKSPFW